MDQSFLLKEGFLLMVVGMLIVYAFLMVLVGAMSFSKCFQRFSYLLPDDRPAAPLTPMPAAQTDDDAARIAVAIAVAKRRSVPFSAVLPSSTPRQPTQGV